jgi:alpha-tubulin suppressor-like RCC1 family protein
MRNSGNEALKGEPERGVVSRSAVTLKVVAIRLAAAALVLVLTVTVILFSRKPSSHRPGRLPLGTNTATIAVGAKHGVMIASDGSLWSWGENTYGWPVLGLANTNVQPSLRPIGSDRNWRNITVGWHHNLAIKSDGTLWGWGQNVHGQLGDGGQTKAQNAPAPLTPGNDWKQAAAGGSHSLALKTDGTLWAFGNNWAGQLGLGITNSPVRAPTQVGSATNWVKVCAGLLESVALQSDGSLWYWGDNPDPAIPQTGPRSANIFTPQRVTPDTNWIDVGFGPWTVLAIKSDGTLWSWGRNAHLFTCTREGSSFATPTRVGTNADWQAISPNGWLYQVLLKKDGSLWALHASYPKPGTNLIVPQLTRLNLKKGFVAFAGGGTRAFGVILTPDGEVWTWGKVLGKDIPESPMFRYFAKLLRHVSIRVDWGEAKPTMRDKPWQLPVCPSDPAP